MRIPCVNKVLIIIIIIIIIAWIGKTIHVLLYASEYKSIA
jgi:hypothetical protein